MGYQRSKRAIRKVEPYLQKMVESKDSIRFPTLDGPRFAYYLREAIHVSKQFAALAEDQPFASYAALSDKFIIRVKGNEVVCEKRDIAIPLATSPEQIEVSLPGCIDTLEVIGAAAHHMTGKMIFPDANEDTVDSEALERWGEMKGYEVVIADNHVTLCRL